MVSFFGDRNANFINYKKKKLATRVTYTEKECICLAQWTFTINSLAGANIWPKTKNFNGVDQKVV